MGKTKATVRICGLSAVPKAGVVTSWSTRKNVRFLMLSSSGDEGENRFQHNSGSWFCLNCCPSAVCMVPVQFLELSGDQDMMSQHFEILGTQHQDICFTWIKALKIQDKNIQYLSPNSVKASSSATFFINKLRLHSEGVYCFSSLRSFYHWCATL